MAQVDDLSVNNGTGVAFRNQLNLILAALASGNAGATAPTVTVPGMIWIDTSGGGVVLRVRDAADAAWVAVPMGLSAAAIATLTGEQTLTNKTLTSPRVNVGGDAVGDLLYRAATGLLTRLGVGTDGQVLSLAAGVPTWAEAAAGGEPPLATADASNDAVIDFTAFDAAEYDSYVFTLSNVIPATDNTYLQMLTSTDGGSTFDTGGSDYAYHIIASDTAGIAVPNSNTANHIQLTWSARGVGSAADEDGVSGTVNVLGPHLARRTLVSADLGYFSNVGTLFHGIVKGARRSSADVDAVRFQFASGNIESGTITMYGRRNA